MQAILANPGANLALHDASRNPGLPAPEVSVLGAARITFVLPSVTVIRGEQSKVL
jgi:hypothetical protein